MRLEHQLRQIASSGILLLIFMFSLAGCDVTATADDTAISSASAVVTLDVQDMT
jgi:hypothetical protein